MKNMNPIITICGSMQFVEEMKHLGKQLEEMGFSVFLPELKEGETENDDSSEPELLIEAKRGFIDAHIEKIRRADGVLFANYKKKNVEGYIGANSFLEIGFAYVFRKPIFLLNEIPDQPNKLEIAGMNPTIIGGNIDEIYRFFFIGGDE